MGHSQEISAAEASIPTTLLSHLWKSKYGVEVDRFFDAPEIRLQADPAGFLRFANAKSGDGRFYKELMRRRGYSAGSKREFKRAAAEIQPDDTVLDVGCGTGNFSTICPGIYRGLETNPGAVEDAVKLGRNVHLGRIEDEDAMYDVVVVFQVLEHVDDPEAFLGCCIQRLRPGGRLIVSTPDMDGFMGHATNEILNYPPHHMTWWSERSLTTLIESCGCTPVDVWHEPLQRVHMVPAMSALLWPPRDGHLTSSPLFSMFYFCLRVTSRLAGNRWQEASFIKGHTLMVMATKGCPPPVLQ